MRKIMSVEDRSPASDALNEFWDLSGQLADLRLWLWLWLTNGTVCATKNEDTVELQ
jgi:hypothetical protein